MANKIVKGRMRVEGSYYFRNAGMLNDLVDEIAAYAFENNCDLRDIDYRFYDNEVILTYTRPLTEFEQAKEDARLRRSQEAKAARKAREEATERAEYERLKAKYGNS